MTVPLLLERIVRAAGDDDDVLRAAFGGELRLGLCGGALLSSSLKQRLRRARLTILDGYGLTETSPTLTLERPGDDALGTVGRAYPQVELRIAEDGEILARGPNVFAGYFRDAEATAAAFADGWFRTGDIGELTTSGHLRILDRKTSIVVLSTGKKVAPQAIEVRAAEDPWIERIVLFGEAQRCMVGLVVPDVVAISAGLGRPVAFPDVATDAGVRAGLEARLSALNGELSACEAVKGFAVAHRPLTVESGHLTPTLKVKRDLVWKEFRGVLEPLWAERPPRNASTPSGVAERVTPTELKGVSS